MEINSTRNVCYSAWFAVRRPGRVIAPSSLADHVVRAAAGAMSSALGGMLVLQHHAAVSSPHVYILVFSSFVVVFVRRPKLARSPPSTRAILFNTGHALRIRGDRIRQD